MRSRHDDEGLFREYKYVHLFYIYFIRIHFHFFFSLKDVDGKTCQHWAVQSTTPAPLSPSNGSQCKQILRVLITDGILFKDAKGRTCLHAAAEYGNVKAAKVGEEIILYAHIHAQKYTHTTHTHTHTHTHTLSLSLSLSLSFCVH